MTDHNTDSEKNGDATAFDAIATISDEGIKRSPITRIKFWGRYIVPSILIALAVWVAYEWSNKLPPLDDVPVAILIPLTESGNAMANAVRQKAGFELAISHNSNSGNSINYIEFDFDELNAKGENKDQRIKVETTRILDEIKRLYYREEGVRIFLATMSGAVARIKPEFIAWSQSLDPRDRPVLIATVASAPDIADHENGVFRHYIRSRDESDVLSTYIESLRPAPRVVGVFFVGDEYGDTANQLFRNRFGSKVESHLLGVVPAQDDVAAAVRRFNSRQDSNDSAVAVVVGYGDMIARTLISLRDETHDIDGVTGRYSGPILVVSTFTEKAWRPDSLVEDSEFLRRIYTVAPNSSESISERRGVVFQFSYLTLDRALKCKDTRGIDEFWSCWSSELTPTNSRARGWAEVEYTANGDSHVSLKLLDHTQWSD